MDDKNDEAAPIAWDIRREGRAWTAEEFTGRVDRLLGVELEVSGGKLFGSEKTRRLILGMLLENVGLDAAVKLGDLSCWNEAIAAIERERAAPAEAPRRDPHLHLLHAVRLRLPMLPDDPHLIYKVCPAAQWRDAVAAGAYRGSAVDLRDGFIHFSTATQLTETLRRHFAGQRDLVLVAVDPDDLGAGLRWEPSRGGEPFPHLYGELLVSLARHVAALDVDEGRPRPPGGS